MRLIAACLLFFPFIASAQNVILSGYVRDLQGRPLQAASVQIPGRRLLTTTDSLGKFHLILKPGIVTVVISYTGYVHSTETISVTHDTGRMFILESKTEELREVEVTSNRYTQADQLQTTRMSSITLGKEDVNSIPMLGGEADLMKMIQLLPGVIRGVEGGTDLFVRGGAADQNLVMLDGAAMYNTGHLLGFMSVFNSDVLESAESMTGAFPAEYGGRLSSILDVRTKSGVTNATQVSGNVGLIASRLMIDQPLIKNKLSISVAGRRTYIDKVVKLVGQNLPYYFYDFNGKLNFKPSERDVVDLSYYTGQDVLSYNRIGQDTVRSRNFTSNFRIGNNAEILKWRRTYSRGWSSVASVIHSNFNYTISSVFENNSLYVTSRIEDLGLKWIIASDSAFRFSFKGGIESTHHHISPNVVNTSGGLSQLLEGGQTQDHIVYETSAFGQGDVNLGTRWRGSFGLRVSSAAVAGKTYVNPEPRLAMRYTVNERTTLKASYSRMAQYLQRVSSAAVAFPTDIWFPVTKDIVPQISNQVSVAFQHTFPDQHVFLSLESYYKQMANLIGYKQGTNLFLNTNFEQQLIQGKGRAYGLELLLKKEAGRFTGWISYTLSKSERQYSQVNDGHWYLARYDRRHNAAVVTSYRLSPRWSFSAVFEFISGSRFTPVIGQYVVPAPTLAGLDLIPVYSKIDAVKLADTHRLDLGVKLRSRPDKKIKGEWFVGVYNVYNRASPIGINIISNGNGMYSYQQPGLFGLLPFISYGFKF